MKTWEAVRENPLFVAVLGTLILWGPIALAEYLCR